jgi:probable FeS assembly SUF system protein SufT
MDLNKKDSSDWVNLQRDCRVIEIPSGTSTTLSANTPVRIMQSRGNAHTVATERGNLYRVDASDADALGMSPVQSPTSQQGPFNEQMIWDQLKTVYDPEIPVNIVDLGLVYSCEIKTLDEGTRTIDVRMAMTAPGCGMADVLKADVESRLSALPSVKDVHVEVVFDPPWNMSRMSEAARLQLGI